MDFRILRDGLIKRLLFYCRSENLRTIRSMALPGGKLDAEENYSTCALRAGRRGWCLAWYKPCSRLFRRLCYEVRFYDYSSGRLGRTELETTINPQEVASVHRIPVTQFFRS